MPSTHPKPYEPLSSKLFDFIYRASPITDRSTMFTLSRFFQPDNVCDFLRKYTHFHVHFSMLHTSSFSASHAYIGLVAGMCCIGACYSTRVSPSEVREVMVLLRTALHSSSRLNALAGGLLSAKYMADSSLADIKSDLEELQAIVLLHVMFVWHGTPTQREQARHAFSLISTLARESDLLRISRDASLYSVLHQPDSARHNFTASRFDWPTWVEQEKRIRTMYIIFLCDVSLGLYFNNQPQFDTHELRLPLPADDAAWDAKSDVECLDAMGIHGEPPAKARNPDGTRRSNQPEMHLVLRGLLDGSHQIRPGTTNLYGKFILIHGLLAMMKRVQVEGSSAIQRSGTPLSQNAWFADGASTVSSGRATPVDLGGSLLDGPTLKTLWTALDKFKAIWDIDMAVQFPHAATPYPRRYGFSKDGIHFYWLATYLLKNTRAADLQMPADHRFMHVIHLLKSVKNWVMSDGAARGEELGSVGDIDTDFGVSELTLDMAQLFTPLPKLVE
jgi:hypothetical protein